MASGGCGGTVEVLQVDEAYEFCAPRFFDFTNEETEEDVRRAELWFETSLSYAPSPSPFMPRIREGRSVQIDSLCDFGNIDQDEKTVPNKVCPNDSATKDDDKTTSKCQPEVEIDVEVKVEQGRVSEDKNSSIEFVSEVKPCQVDILPRLDTSFLCDKSSSLAIPCNLCREEVHSSELPITCLAVAETASPAYIGKQHSLQKVVAPTTMKKYVTVGTPESLRIPEKRVEPSNRKNLTASKIANVIQQPSVSKKKTTTPPLQSSKSMETNNAVKHPGKIPAKNSNSTEIAQENQAIKRQKLDDGKSRQIHNVKNRILPHKSKLGLADVSNLFSSGAKGCREEKSLHMEASPFISAAEMINKFQSRTRDLDLSQNRTISHDNATSIIQRPKLTLTRPKDPQLETAHRIRAVKIKSFAELEEEMLSKIPKFRARPLNKKILEASAFPSLPKSVPKPPVFQEFRFKTMERANQHAETLSVASSVDSAVQNQIKVLKLTEPRPPHLETLLRARPSKVKSSEELELEELEKMPQFKARPLDKKILESKGDVGLFCNPKPQITVPEEFHFATNDRLGPSAAVVELFDKLSLHSESSNHEKNAVPRITIPNPFHLHTEERGLEKERQFAEQLLQKELEERTRIPKATPYPYTTDYPVIPPKPKPKQCTKPEAFQLESLVRHEEEMQRKLEEIARAEREEAQRRVFRAQPILKDDPFPIPERERKPLTEVQEFVLHVDHRAVQRTEFDNKIKEKESTYKRIREEQEYAKMIEEEKAMKQMRRTMVPHARPLPKFDNPFFPQKSMKEATKAKSPDLRVNHRMVRRQTTIHMR